MIMRTTGAVSPGLLLLAVLACGGGTSTSDDRAVARYRGGLVTAGEIDARLVALPPKERPVPGEDLQAWMTEQVEELVVERVLLREARDSGLDQEDAFAAARIASEKSIVRSLCLAEPFRTAAEISEADLEAAFTESADRLRAPERRSVSQVFLRRSPDAEVRIRGIRERVFAGEIFGQLARELSDSESRHRDGALGWITPGQLPAALERVVFGLEEGVPSEPVETPDGVHLFLVDTILPARTLTFDEARPLLRSSVESQRREAVLDEIDERTSLPAGSFVPEPRELGEMLRSGDPEREVLRVGDLRWTLADLFGQLRRGAGQGRASSESGDPADTAWAVLDRARRAEEIYLDCLERASFDSERVDADLAVWEESALVDAQRRRRLLRLADEDEERLRHHHRGNLGEFSSPPTWTVHRLRIPIAPGAGEVMSRLEEAARDQVGIEALRERFGGEVEELDAKTLAELGSVEPKLPALVAPLSAGTTTAPYRTADALEIARVVARTEPVPTEFEDVRSFVAERYLRQYRADLYRSLKARILADVEFRLSEEGLAALQESGVPEPDLSVERLDEMLESL